MKKIKIEIKWAFVFIVATLLWMLLERLAGLHDQYIDKHQYFTMIFVILAVWIYVLALKDKKKRYYNGRMSFKQSFVSGVIISVILMLFAPLTQWITSVIVTPGYFTNVIAHSVKTGYYKTVEEAEAYFNLKNYMVQSAISALVMGAITSAVVALFVRTKTVPA